MIGCCKNNDEKTHDIKTNQMLFVTCVEYNSEMLTYKPLTNIAVLRKHLKKNIFFKEHQ